MSTDIEGQDKIESYLPSPQRSSYSPVPANLALGVILIGLGGVLLLAQLFDFRLGHYLWPLYILVPGGLIFVFALVTGGSAGEGLVILGSLVSTVGALLFYQNLTGHWVSWAYAWALVAPTSVGVGQIIYGLLRGRADLVKVGINLVTIGGLLFLAGAVFFELIIGISGFGLGRAWPLLLIVLGVLLLIRAFLPDRWRSR